MRIIWRALLSFGPVFAVAASFVLIGEVATEFRGQSRMPDLGLLRGAYSPVEAPAGLTAVQGTDGDDVILVARTGQDGALSLDINGWRRDYAAGEQHLAVLGRGGEDLIRVDDGVRQGLTLDGGVGDDVLVGGDGDDVLFGGDGDDIVRARAGDDVVDAGEGDDDVRLGDGHDGADGGEGRDRLSGGDGGDYLQGGRGRDLLHGGPGDDVLYGLDGGDSLKGASGADFLDGGRGDDDLTGGEDRDSAFGGIGDDLLRDAGGGDLLGGGGGRDAFRTGDGSRVLPGDDPAGAPGGKAIAVVDDAYDFGSRVRSDLETLRSLPLGRELLARLAVSGWTVEIRPTDGGNGVTFDSRADACLRPDGQAGAGTSSRLFYNPYRTAVGSGREAWHRRPPIVGLFHELVHALAAAEGRLPADDDDQQVQAVGDYERNVTARTRRTTLTLADDRPPGSPTENGFRALLGLPLRALR